MFHCRTLTWALQTWGQVCFLRDCWLSVLCFKGLNHTASVSEITDSDIGNMATALAIKMEEFCSGNIKQCILNLRLWYDGIRADVIHVHF